MTKCVATAVTRTSETSGRRRDTVWNISTSFEFLRQSKAMGTCARALQYRVAAQSLVGEAISVAPLILPQVLLGDPSTLLTNHSLTRSYRFLCFLDFFRVGPIFRTGR